jgi:NRAMP (natural resistance-associated macrophage protein)-like metal ion transporter
MSQSPKAGGKKPRNIIFRLLGPGLVTGAADDDPSGIATYSQAGAQFGYGLLWTVFLTTPFMIAIQLVSAEIGRVTGKGLAANVSQFAPRWFMIFLVSLLVVANTFNIAADIAAMGEALALVVGGLKHEHALIFAATSVLLQVFVPYHRYAPVLLLSWAQRSAPICFFGRLPKKWKRCGKVSIADH